MRRDRRLGYEIEWGAMAGCMGLGGDVRLPKEVEVEVEVEVEKMGEVEVECDEASRK